MFCGLRSSTSACIGVRSVAFRVASRLSWRVRSEGTGLREGFGVGVRGVSVESVGVFSVAREVIVT